MKHLLNILATWRLMELLKDEDAPFDILAKFREYVERNRYYEFIIPNYDTGKVSTPVNDTIKGHILNEIYEALQCDWCLSIWGGLFVAIATQQNIVYALAYSAGALFLSPIFKAVIQDKFNLETLVYDLRGR